MQSHQEIGSQTNKTDYHISKVNKEKFANDTKIHDFVHNIQVHE